MKILFSSHSPDFKGSCISMYQLIKGLDRGRFTPVAVFSKDGPLAGMLKDEGVAAYVLKSRGFLGIGLVKEALRLIKDEGIGLVHLNSAVPFNKYVAIAARLSGVRCVWHIREDPYGKKVRRLSRWIRWTADGIFAVSTEIYDYFKHTGKAVRIYNGVDLGEFKPGMDGKGFREKHGIPDGSFVFGIVGTIEPRKGTELFIKAAREVARSDGETVFMVVGSGLPEHETSLKRLILSSPELEGRVVLTGRIPDVADALSSMDVLVMPSTWEGFPRALIEAMASGVPSIATGVGEVPYILEDGKTGYIIPKGDLSALVHAMKRFMKPGVNIKEMGNMARERALGLSIERHVHAVQDQYDMILK